MSRSAESVKPYSLSSTTMDDSGFIHEATADIKHVFLLACAQIPYRYEVV